MPDKATVEVFRIEEPGHPYPWRFAVTYRGVRHQFVGIPNQCATRRSAAMRARWRARWLERGSFDEKYEVPEVSR